MNILHLVWTFMSGGLETMLVNIVNEQVLYDNNVGVVIINNKIDQDLLDSLDDNVKVFKINRPEGCKNLWYLVKLNFCIAKFHPNAVHCHWDTLINCILPLYRKRCILTQHYVGVHSSSFQLIKKYARICAISKSVQKSLTLYGIDSILVYNGINVSCIENKSVWTSLNGGVIRIVAVGRLEKNSKGQDLLIEAVRQIDNVFVDFIGDGPDADIYKEMIHEYGLEARVNLIGRKSQSYVFLHLKDYDLFVLPSRKEGFGLAVAEAMVAKLPVLICDLDGPMEVIDYGKYGMFFKCASSVDLTKKICEIVSNGYTFDVNLASQFVKTHFDVRNTAKEYISVYKFLTL